jgi:hydroxymethylglutaryl-CoA reductase (NADPH)
MVDLHIKKNLIGSIVSGGLLTGNAHYANMLLATYLATGQDAANIVEGSQGITHLEVKKDALYMSVNIPNIIVGTVGHGKTTFAERFKLMGCEGPHASEKLAMIIGGVVLAGELSLLAALTNQHELVKSHQAFERR